MCRPLNLHLMTHQWTTISSQHLASFIWVAHSGGADSTALVYAINQWSQSLRALGTSVSWGICHVNYRLRGLESDLDAAFSEKLAHSFGVPLRLLLAPAAPKTGTQAWARKIRRSFWRELVQEGGLVALGHHLDDLAENALFRMARGTSLRSLAGMTTWTPPLWRPLLPYSKVDLKHWLQQWSAVYREDSSNGSPKYSRNRIRNEILPVLEEMFPGAAQRIATLALDAQEIHHKVEKQVDSPSLATVDSFATYIKDHYQLLGYPPPQLSRSWLKAAVISQNQLSQKAKPIQIPGRKAVVIQEGSHLTIHTSQEIFMKPIQRHQMHNSLSAPMISCFLPSQANVVVFRDPQRLNDRQNKFLKISNTDTVPHEIRIESIQNNLTLHSGHRKMRIKELFRSWRIPYPQRCRWRIIKYDGKVSCLSDGLAVWDKSAANFNLEIQNPITLGSDESTGVSNDTIEKDHVVWERSMRQGTYQIINVFVPDCR